MKINLNRRQNNLQVKPTRLFPLLFAALLAVPGVTQQPPASTPAAPSPEAAVDSATTPIATGQISGTVRAGETPLPGVTVSAANTLTGKKLVTSTRTDGSFSIKIPGRGRWVVRAELAAFAVETREVLFTPENLATPQRVDFELVLLSRKVATPEPGAESQGPAANAARALSGSGYQNLGLVENQGVGGAEPSTDSVATSLPGGGVANDMASESISITGAMGRTENYGFNQDDLRDRIDQARARGELGPGGGGMLMGGPGGAGGGGNFVIMGGGPGGFGGGGLGGRRGRRGFDVNQIHGQVFYNVGDSIFDARPYSLTGNPSEKPGYSQSRFGFFLGGPLKIPKIYKGDPKTLFFLNYFGQRASNPFDVFATVPTLAQRNGDFSQTLVSTGPNAGTPVAIFDPVTHTPFAGNVIPTSLINPAAQGLLGFFPAPNLPGDRQNFHRVTSADNNAQNVNFRLIHNFSGTTAGPTRGRSGFGGNSLNIGFNYRQSDSDLPSFSPQLTGTMRMNGLNFSAGYSKSIGKLTGRFTFNANRNHAESGGPFQGVQNVEAQLGINGVSQNPFDWGVPSLSFTNFNSLSDLAPSLRNDWTYTGGATFGWLHKKHNVRFGGGYSRLLTDLRANSNPRGSFVFTGFATSDLSSGTPAAGTGYDLADFLLGLAQQSAIQFTGNTYQFRGNSYNAFIQDDWRVWGNLTFNLGLRYEYVSPMSEISNRLVNLDVAPGFTAVAPVQPLQAGPFTGVFPVSLIQPDRNNFAPRVGLAWRIHDKTILRAGYGINYNTSQYSSMVRQLAFQPPFSFTETNIATALAPINLQNGFPSAAATVTNNFAVERNYRLGYVQSWNLNVQQELPGNMIMNLDYTGSKGTHLDLLRAPNRGPDGLRIPDVQTFLFESSDADSTMNSGTIRIRKRMQQGVSFGGSYTYSKSLDNASQIGGGTQVVAQNDLDLAAERGLSSFDQRHRFTADYVFELPFGSNKRWLNSGTLPAKIFGDWTYSGQISIASGTPWTARVLGNFLDVQRGTNGTLRADYLGGPIYLGGPTVSEWFNTAVFAVPPTGQFGDSQRNLIVGPGIIDFDMALSKTILLKESRSLEFRIAANNVFNHANFSGLDTVVNSPTFGRVTSVASMRKMQLMARFNF